MPAGEVIDYIKILNSKEEDTTIKEVKEQQELNMAGNTLPNGV